MIEESDQLGLERLKRLNTFKKEEMMKDLKEIHIPKVKKTLGQKFGENIKSGLIVGMVNLPMCISFAVASGTYPQAGVLSGVWGGIFGGLIGGSYYNVLGPAGALCGFLAKFVSRWGPDALPWCSIFCGVFTLITLIFNLGKYIDIFPASVNEGFTMGIAFGIFFGQMSNALGMPPFPKSTQHEEESILNFIGKNLYHIGEMNSNALALFIVFFMALFILLKVSPKIPWLVIINILGIILGYLDLLGISEFNLITLQKKFGDMNLKLFIWPKIPADSPFMLIDPDFYVDCLPIAFVVVLECLIAAKIADSVTKTKFHIQRELKGLFISNLVVGAFGGMPSTGSLPRTALNVKSGATHKYSSLISSGILFVMGFIFFPLFKYLPLPVIAAQMCFISARMINFDQVFNMIKEDKANFYLFLAVFIVSVLTDPIVGLFFGLLIYQIIFSELLLNPYSEVLITEDKLDITANNARHIKSNLKEHFWDIPDKEGKYLIYRLVGVVNFMNIDIHKERILSLARSDENATVVLSLRYMNITDANSLEAFKALIDEIESNNPIRKIPKNFQAEFMTDGEIIVPEIEEPLETIKHLGKNIIITGLSQSKYNKFHNTDWFRHLKNKGQLIIGEEINLDLKFDV